MEAGGLPAFCGGGLPPKGETMSEYVVGKKVMPRARIDEFYHRFPSLRRYADINHVQDIQVRQIDLDLLTRRPGTGHASHSHIDFILIAPDHTELLRIRRPYWHRVPRRWIGSKEVYIPSMNLDEALASLGLIPLGYILEIYDECPEENYGPKGLRADIFITIHRLPNKTSLRDWLDRQRARISQEVGEEIERSGEKNVVIVLSGTNTKTARLEGGQLNDVGFGSSEYSAVGQLILEDPERFGITIVREK